MAALEGTPAPIARDFGVGWSMVWSAVERIAREHVDDSDGVGTVTMVSLRREGHAAGLSLTPAPLRHRRGRGGQRRVQRPQN